MAAEKSGFVVRISAEDEIDLAAFDEAARERETNREELVRELMRQFLKRIAGEEEEQYYTIKGYSDDHKVFAYIHNMDGMVNFNSEGIEYRSLEWQAFEHANDLVERSEPGDKEEAIKLFQSIFGERNVFVKDE
jgi:hypothetical protein